MYIEFYEIKSIQSSKCRPSYRYPEFNYYGNLVGSKFRWNRWRKSDRASKDSIANRLTNATMSEIWIQTGFSQFSTENISQSLELSVFKITHMQYLWYKMNSECLVYNDLFLLMTILKSFKRIAKTILLLLYFHFDSLCTSKFIE